MPLNRYYVSYRGNTWNVEYQWLEYRLRMAWEDCTCCTCYWSKNATPAQVSAIPWKTWSKLSEWLHSLHLKVYLIKGLCEWIYSFSLVALLSDQVVVFERAAGAAVCLACIHILKARSELACWTSFSSWLPNKIVGFFLINFSSFFYSHSCSVNWPFFSYIWFMYFC